MQTHHAKILTGHLNDYPLPDLIGILHHQRETGRLLVEFPNHPGVFDFENGHMIDAQFDIFRGLPAVRIALAQPKAAFNFDSQVRPTQRTIDAWSQKVILELFGCWGGEVHLEMAAAAPADGAREVAAPPSPPPAPATSDNFLHESQPAAAEAAEAAPAGDYRAPAAIEEMRAALLPSSLTLPPPHRRRQVTLFAGGAVCLLLLGLSAAISLTNRASQTDAAPSSSSAAQPSAVSPGAEATTTAVAVNTLSGQVADALPPANKNSSRTSSPNEATTSPLSNKFRKMNNEPGGAPAPSDPRAKSEKTTRATPLAASPTAVAAAAPAERAQEKAKKQTPDAADGAAVKVVMQVENGRVVRASVVNSRPGMRAFEALALRIARNRRYATKTGEETMTIKVNPSQPQ